MCAWDASKPAASGYLVSADLRSNWTAVAQQNLGRNLLGDPDFLIWATGTSGNVPSWWNISGQTSDGNIARFVSSTEVTVPGGNSAIKLTYDSALTVWQNAISTGDLTTSIKAALDGQSISAAGWVYSDSNDCKLQLNGPASTVLSSAVPASTWTWLKRTIALASSTITRLGMGIRLNAAGSAYFACPTLVFGPIAPDYYVPAESRVAQANFYINDVGTAEAKAQIRLNKPWIVEGVLASAAVGAASCDVVVSVGHFEGTSFVAVISTGNRLSIGAIGGYHQQEIADGVVRARSFDAPTCDADTTDSMLKIALENATSGGNKHINVSIVYTTYDPPLQTWRANWEIFK